MSTRYVAALDQGTTSTRCMLFDQQGQMVSMAQREHAQFFPQSGWVEHDPLEIWSVTQRVLRRALADVGADPAQIVGLGITNQRETTVVWDRSTGQPVHRAIVWQDTRTSDLLGHICDENPDLDIQRISGLPLANYFSGPKVRWLLDANEEIADRAHRGDLLFGTMDTWLVWNLTGGVDGGRHVTDVTNASRTMMMNLETLDWDERLLAAMRVPRAMLPEIVPTVGHVALTRQPFENIPITAIIGDQQSALFGQTAFNEGEAKCTFGTGSFLLLNTGTTPVRSRHGLVTTVAHKFANEPPTYALEGSVAVAGTLVQWFRDNLGLIRSVAEVETLASTVPSNGGCYIVPAFAGLFAPHWQPEARGIVVGLTSYVTKAHLCRAVLEAVAWQTYDVVDAMNADAGTPLTQLAVDGGMTADNLLMQIIADVLDVDVVRPVLAETVARGAAYAAGVGAGFWPDRWVLRRAWRQAARWTPQMDPSVRDAQMEQWRRAVQLAIAWGQ